MAPSISSREGLSTSQTAVGTAVPAAAPGSGPIGVLLFNLGERAKDVGRSHRNDVHAHPTPPVTTDNLSLIHSRLRSHSAFGEGVHHELSQFGVAAEANHVAG